MLKFFSIVIYSTNFIAIIAALLFVLIVMIRHNTFNIEAFEASNKQLNSCRIVGVVFVFLYWLIVTGDTVANCIAGYNMLARTCAFLGSAWIVFAIVDIIFSIFMGIKNRTGDEMAILSKLRKSSFWMGTIYLLFAFLLKVV